MLDHRPYGEIPEESLGQMCRSIAKRKRADGGAVAAPSCPLIRRCGGSIRGGRQSVLKQGECVRNAAHNEPVLEVAEPVQVLQYQPELPHKHRILETWRPSGTRTRRKVRVEFGNKERVVRRQRRDELRTYGEILVLAVAGAASPAVSVELFKEKKCPS